MEHKRITLLAGHYGSGKTNIAVNLAFALKKAGEDVVIADLDIVNPYFRTKDSERELREAGIALICSPYAGSNLDIPALPQELYAVTDDRSKTAVLDIGGDDRGALALGRYTPAILEENNYEMLLVANRFRPLTRDVKSTLEVMREVEAASGIPFTAVVNNSNLGEETAPEDVLSSVLYGQELSAAAGIPLKFTSVDQRLFTALKDRIPNLFPLRLQEKIK